MAARTKNSWALALVLASVACREGDIDLPPAPDLSEDISGPGDLPPGEGPGFVLGAKDRFLLSGRVVTPSAVLPKGEVLVIGDRIACVAETCFGTPGRDGATFVRTAGTLYPGLVDAHNHTQYNYLPPWQAMPPRLFDNRGQWAARADYKAHTSSVNVGEGMYGCQQVKYGEIRALLGGVTTMQGTGSMNRRCYRTLVHNAEHGNELGIDRMRTNIPGIDGISVADAATIAAQMGDGSLTAFVIHLAEGKDEVSRREFDTLVGKGLLAKATVLIHGTALGQPEFTLMGQAGAKLVWSPLSNLLLYGQTTDVPKALAAGVPVALAPDWTPSGSPTLLGELKVAAKVSKEQFGGALDAKRLTEMVTSTAADVLALGQIIGRLQMGFLADVLVLSGAEGDAYEALVAARPEDVQLVMVSGRMRYGDVRILDASPQPRCEVISMCGAEKRLCVPDTEDAADTLNEDLSAIRKAIQTFYPMPYRLDICE